VHRSFRRRQEAVTMDDGRRPTAVRNRRCYLQRMIEDLTDPLCLLEARPRRDTNVNESPTSLASYIATSGRRVANLWWDHSFPPFWPLDLCPCSTKLHSQKSVLFIDFICLLNALVIATKTVLCRRYFICLRCRAVSCYCCYYCHEHLIATKVFDVSMVA